MRLRTSLAIASLALAACGDGLPVSPRFLLTFRAARERWQSRGIASYELTIRRLCYCGLVDPVRVRVVDAVIVSRTVVPTGEPVPAVYERYFPDVPGLFAIVEQAMVDADELDAKYDPVYGFPSEINIDWIENAIDDEVTYSAEAFTGTP